MMVTITAFKSITGSHHFIFSDFITSCYCFHTLDRGATRGRKRGNVPGAESLEGAEKPQQCRKYFNTVHLLSKYRKGSNTGTPNLFLAPGAIYVAGAIYTFALNMFQAGLLSRSQ